MLYLYGNVLWSNEYGSRHLYIPVFFNHWSPTIVLILDEEIMKKQ